VSAFWHIEFRDYFKSLEKICVCDTCNKFYIYSRLCLITDQKIVTFYGSVCESSYCSCSEICFLHIHKNLYIVSRMTYSLLGRRANLSISVSKNKRPLSSDYRHASFDMHWYITVGSLCLQREIWRGAEWLCEFHYRVQKEGKVWRPGRKAV